MPSARPGAAAGDGLSAHGAAVPQCAPRCHRTRCRGTVPRLHSARSPSCDYTLDQMSQIVQSADFHRHELLMFKQHGAAQCGYGASNARLRRPRPRPWATPYPWCCGSAAPPSRPPLACVLHPSDRHLCRGAASQSWSPRPPASVRPRRMSKPPSKSRSSTSISIFRVSGHLVWPLWRASGRVSDARCRVWRTGNPSAGRGRAQFTRADDPGVSGPAERCRWAARSVACG